jgi:hypothetical protein
MDDTYTTLWSRAIAPKYTLLIAYALHSAEEGKAIFDLR